jgi:hypothetical protein
MLHETVSLKGPGGSMSYVVVERPGWLNELGSWITEQLIQAYHQYGVGSRPAL